MTHRDAFVLGVSTYCKTAEMDAADTIAFVDLLMASPDTGAALVKRAAAQLVKGVGLWGGGGQAKVAEPPYVPNFSQQDRGWLRSKGFDLETALATATPPATSPAPQPDAGGGDPNVVELDGSDPNVIELGGGTGGTGGTGGWGAAIEDAAAPGGKNVASGSASADDYPTATQGDYLSGLTGLKDKAWAMGIDRLNQRRQAEKVIRRQLRQLGLSFGDAERMTPAQMAGANYSPEVRSILQSAQKFRGEQRAAAGGRGFSQYGGGFSSPSAAPSPAPSPAPPPPAASTPSAPQAAAASSSPPTERQIGNVPMRSTTDPTVNPGGAEYTGPTWTGEATSAGAMQSRQNQAAQQLSQFAQRRPELKREEPEHFKFTGGASPVSALSSQGRTSNPATAAASSARPPAGTPWSASGSVAGGKQRTAAGVW